MAKNRHQVRIAFEIELHIDPEYSPIAVRDKRATDTSFRDTGLRYLNDSEDWSTNSVERIKNSKSAQRRRGQAGACSERLCGVSRVMVVQFLSVGRRSDCSDREFHFPSAATSGSTTRLISTFRTVAELTWRHATLLAFPSLSYDHH